MDTFMHLIQEFLEQTLIYQIMLVIIIGLGLLAIYWNIKRQEAEFEARRLNQYLADLPNSLFNNHHKKPKIVTTDKLISNTSNPGALGKFSSLTLRAIYGASCHSMKKVAMPDITAEIRLFIKWIIGRLEILCQSKKRRIINKVLLTCD